MGLIADGRTPADEHLAVEWFGALDREAEHAGIDRHIAPAQNLQSLFARGFPPEAFDILPVDRFARHEQEADAILPGLGQIETEPLGLFGEQAMGQLDQHACTIAGLGIGADCAAVFEVLQNLQAVGDDLMALEVVDVGDETDAAGIVLMSGIIESMGLRKSFRQMGKIGHGHILSKRCRTLIHSAALRRVREGRKAQPKHPGSKLSGRCTQRLKPCP